MDENICKYDLVNRFPSYTFTESKIGNQTKYEAKNGNDIIISMTENSSMNAACFVRYNLVGHEDILPLLTTAQRDTLSEVCEGTQICNITTNVLNTYINGSWR